MSSGQKKISGRGTQDCSSCHSDGTSGLVVRASDFKPEGPGFESRRGITARALSDKTRPFGAFLARDFCFAFFLDWDNAERGLRRGEAGSADDKIVYLKNAQRPKKQCLGAKLKTADPDIAMARLAQWLERRTSNPKVPGSNPVEISQLEQHATRFGKLKRFRQPAIFLSLPFSPGTIETRAS